MLALDDVPIEDIARGMFPAGADEYWEVRERGPGWEAGERKERTDAPVPFGLRDRHQPAVVKRIREARMLHLGIWSVRAWVTTTEYVGRRKHNMISAVHLQSTGQLSVGFTTRMQQKPFLLKLPKWLRFETLYDTVDFAKQPLRHMSFDLYDANYRRGVVDISLLRDGSKNSERHNLVVIR